MSGKTRHFFDDTRWAVAAPLVEQVLGPGPKGDLRRFVEAVVWILRSGAPWRDLATSFGPWQRAYRRYRRWALAGRWERLRRTLGFTKRPRLLLIDSTIVKTHAHGAGALKRAGRQGLGRSRGGFTTKLHAAVSERGELIRYHLTGGEVADVTQARALLRHRGKRYRERNVIERWFGRLKAFRRIATRYEKTALSYLGAVAVSAWLVALTGWRG